MLLVKKHIDPRDIPEEEKNILLDSLFDIACLGDSEMVGDFLFKYIELKGIIWKEIEQN